MKSQDPLGDLQQRVSPTATGIEIGAHALPVAGLHPIYIDCVKEYAGSESRVDILADARLLPFPSDALDYVCSSHVLEHLPNPVAALMEWHRVIKPGGYLYLVVPDRNYTFDITRKTTSIDHIVCDFIDGVEQADERHISDFIYNSDWGRLNPDTPSELVQQERDRMMQAYLLELKAGRHVDIHYHTFTPESLYGILRECRLIEGFTACFDLVSSASQYPVERGDGIAVLLRKRRRWRLREKRSKTYLFHNGLLNVPLVCPCGLTSLRFYNRGESEQLLGDDANEYFFDDGIPSLINRSSPSVRRWSQAVYRKKFFKYGRFA
jgi:SAM-dependent methyltransferase